MATGRSQDTASLLGDVLRGGPEVDAGHGEPGHEGSRPRRPQDHPEFFRWPAPEGRSRESSIVLDGQGRFFHDGQLVQHPRLLLSLCRWIRRHPDDGRYILCNGYDWTYFAVEDVPFFVTAVESRHGDPRLRLSDDSRLPLRGLTLRIGPQGAFYVGVKGGEFDARFTPAAQASMVPYIAESAAGEPVLSVLGQESLIEGASEALDVRLGAEQPS